MISHRQRSAGSYALRMDADSEQTTCLEGHAFRQCCGSLSAPVAGPRRIPAHRYRPEPPQTSEGLSCAAAKHKASCHRRSRSCSDTTCCPGNKLPYRRVGGSQTFPVFRTAIGPQRCGLVMKCGHSILQICFSANRCSIWPLRAFTCRQKRHIVANPDPMAFLGRTAR